MIKHPMEREWLELTPKEFEARVVEYLGKLGIGLRDFTIQQRGKISGPHGEFEIDGLAEFEALGAKFLVFIECKHYKSRVKREQIQILFDRLMSCNAQKGMLFATGGFQRGAIEYATSRRIALVHFTKGAPIYETRDRISKVEVPCHPFASYFVFHSDTGGLVYKGGYEDIRAFLFEDSTMGK